MPGRAKVIEMIKVQFGPNGETTVSGTSQKSQHTMVAGIDGLRLEGGANPSVSGITRAQGVAAEFQNQLNDLDAKLATERARIEELQEFDKFTGQRGFRKSADGTTRRAEEAAKHIQGRIDALQRTRDAQHAVAGLRWSQAHAADVDAASRPSEAQLEVAARQEREDIAAQNDIRARHGLPPTGLLLK
jgi:hypothetical protein